MAIKKPALTKTAKASEILRNEARHHGVNMERLIIPEDGESIAL